MIGPVKVPALANADRFDRREKAEQDSRSRNHRGSDTCHERIARLLLVLLAAAQSMSQDDRRESGIRRFRVAVRGPWTAPQ